VGSATRLTNGWFVVSGGVLLVAVLAGTLVGAVRLPAAGIIGEVLDPLPFVSFEGLSQGHGAILWQIRLPRVVLGGLVGAMLSASGAAYQGVFRNPLADPYLLGAAAGAGLGATLAIVYGPDTTSWPIDLLPLAAFVGAVGGVMIAYTIGRAAGTARSAGALILAGVAVASFLTALQTYFQQQNAETLREVYGWILGRLGTAGWDEVLLMLPYAAISGGVLLLHRRLLDVMAMGDEEAEAVGLDADPEMLQQARAKAAEAGVELRLDEGFSTELPYEDASFDLVLSTLFFHHLDPESKRVTAGEIARVLKPGGELRVADYGAPSDPLMALTFLGIRVFDGFDNTRDNFRGALPEIFERSGLSDAEQTGRLRTIFGTLAHYRAQRPEHLERLPAR
jgi:ABC-type Fe3+-siderophore transport system permease subunit